MGATSTTYGVWIKTPYGENRAMERRKLLMAI